MKKLAIDLSKSPLTLGKNYTEAQIESILSDFARRHYMMSRRFQLTNGTELPKYLDEEAYFKAVLISMAGILTYKDLPAQAQHSLNKAYEGINKVLFKGIEEGFEALARDWSSSHPKTLQLGETLSQLWAKHPTKVVTTGSNLTKVHNMTLLINEPSMTASQKDKLVKALNDVHTLVSASKVPFFKDALYGNFIVLKANDIQIDETGKYIDQTDEIWLMYDEIVSLPEQALVHVIIHELGHRYYQKVLNDVERHNWLDYYSTLLMSEEKGLPKVGESLFLDYNIQLTNQKTGEKTIPGSDTIIKVDSSDPSNLKFHFKFPSGSTGVLTEASFLKANPPHFPSMYSKTNKEEFFCETIAFYTTGKIRPDLKKTLEAEFKNRFITPFEDPDTAVLKKKTITDLHALSPSDIKFIEKAIKEIPEMLESITANESGLLRDVTKALKTKPAKGLVYVKKELMKDFVKLLEKAKEESGFDEDDLDDIGFADMFD
jgi:hypothetical protein